ncbi:unnamed protein product [Gongylonema pulchrum]|uniref:HTH_Tnp_Tc3_1 domain-containing protein n=1 Tax=Gongylonema pulchrum TaxID=637853 RepID=A0A183DNF6_9BILA|nr:unnamed protein product [Gongylonema pulchrum]
MQKKRAVISSAIIGIDRFTQIIRFSQGLGLKIQDVTILARVIHISTSFLLRFRPTKRQFFAGDHPLNFIRTKQWSPAKKKRVQPNLFKRSSEGDWVFNNQFSVKYFREKGAFRLESMHEQVCASFLTCKFVVWTCFGRARFFFRVFLPCSLIVLQQQKHIVTTHGVCICMCVFVCLGIPPRQTNKPRC